MSLDSPNLKPQFETLAGPSPSRILPLIVLFSRFHPPPPAPPSLFASLRFLLPVPSSVISSFRLPTLLLCSGTSAAQLCVYRLFILVPPLPMWRSLRDLRVAAGTLVSLGGGVPNSLQLRTWIFLRTRTADWHSRAQN